MTITSNCFSRLGIPPALANLTSATIYFERCDTFIAVKHSHKSQAPLMTLASKTSLLSLYRVTKCIERNKYKR